MDTEVLERSIPIIAILSTIALPVIVALVLIFKKIDSNHKERMGLIQQGIIPPNEPKRKSTPNRYISLRNGIIFIALGVGLIFGILGTQELEYADGFSLLFTTAVTVFFLGIGYLVFFLITKNVKEYKILDLESEFEEDAE